MNNVRNTAVILVILAGIAGSYFILKNPDSGVALGENGKISELTNQILSKNPIQWIEKAKEQISSVGAMLGNSSINASSQQINLTGLVVGQALGDMQNMIQSGDNSTAFDPNDPKNKEAIQNAISGIQDPLSYYDLSINEKAINISQGDPKQSLMNYLEGISVVFSQSDKVSAYKRPTDAVDKAILSGDYSGLNKLVETYQNLFNGFIRLSVPSAQLELHKKYLRFFKKAEVVYSGINDFQSDPIKASLFFQMVPDIINEEIEIRKEYYKLATSQL